jgi:hypothetical protein
MSSSFALRSRKPGRLEQALRASPKQWKSWPISPLYANERKRARMAMEAVTKYSHVAARSQLSAT